MTSGLRNLGIVAAVAIGLTGIYFARSVLVPFLLAAVIAYTLNPVVAALERRGVRRTLGAILVLAALALALAGAVALVVPETIRQFQQFSDRLPGYIQAIQGRLEPMETYLRERYPEQLEAIRAKALDWGRGILPALIGGLAAGIKGALTSVVKLVLWLLTIIVVPVFAYYLLADYHDVRQTLLGLIPQRHRPFLAERIGEIDRVLRVWLKSQLTVAMVLAVIYSVGLTLLGVPLGLLIGVVGGLANMVPYLGLVVGFLPAALLSLLETGSWVSLLLVAGVFIFGQVLEGTVISPRIMGAGLGLPPAVILLAVLVGGDLFGFTGLLLAVPATAAGLVLLNNARKAYDQSIPSESPPGSRLAAGRPLRRRRPTA